ncbi:MAG: TfoX/Sxy family protein [Solirubrobacteraceae bacterium]
MAYDEDLAWRVREQLAEIDAVATEKRMFGGLAFLIGGHMAVAVSGNGGLMLRGEPGEPHTEPIEMRGRTMRGWARVRPAALEGDAQLAEWVRRGVAAAATLPAKA